MKVKLKGIDFSSPVVLEF